MEKLTPTGFIRASVKPSQPLLLRATETSFDLKT
jgi:hypothetical protein